jgi:hypothetical protein
MTNKNKDEDVIVETESFSDYILDVSGKILLFTVFCMWCVSMGIVVLYLKLTK